MIRTFLGRPARAGEWALSSFVLLVLSAGGLVAAFILPGDYLKLAATAAHGLLWWQVLRGGAVPGRGAQRLATGRRRAVVAGADWLPAAVPAVLVQPARRGERPSLAAVLTQLS